MCFLKTPEQAKMPARAPAPPEDPAEPTEIGTPRAREDEALFGGAPDLRTDRSVSSGGTSAGGTGLKMM